MLIIGSLGRNSGKTLLASEVIGNVRGILPPVGLKLTTIREKGGSCPRGGDGCGVCGSLDGTFCLTEETNRESAKDTSRLLAAGAARVFWLRAMKDHLGEGLKECLGLISCETPIVCESNSLRTIVDPGVFIMTKKKEKSRAKASAAEVLDLADRIVLFDGLGFDPGLEELFFDRCEWMLREPATAIILAGGKSSRMGMDKALLSLQGKPMIQRVYEGIRGHFDEVLISARDPGQYAFLGAVVVPDKVPDQGPLMGIASALEASSREKNFVIAGDIPDPDLHLARRMLREVEGYDAVVPVSANGCPEPLFAVYKKTVLPQILKILSSGKRRVRDFFELCRVKKILMDKESPFININTLRDYDDFRKSLGRKNHDIF